MSVLPGQAVVPSGVILTGRIGDPIPRPAWAIDGSFMAFRHLQQKVPEFNAYTLANAIRVNAGGFLTQQQGAEFLGARMFGRWKSGAPLDLAPLHDEPALGADPLRNNLFNYGDALVDESRCPFSAHVRKTNPRLDLPVLEVINHGVRSSIPYGPETPSAELASGVSAQDRGLLFGTPFIYNNDSSLDQASITAEYQSVIDKGFRFQQRIWANDPL